MSTTTEQLIEQAKEQADLVDVDYISDEKWLEWIVFGQRELHRYVTNQFKATYYRTYDFTLSGESQLLLPSNFWRLKGLDLDPDTVRRREVRPFNFQERNRFRGDTGYHDNYCADRRYNLVGSRRLQIQPQDKADGTYRLYYTPTPKPLALVRTIVRDNPNDSVAASGPTYVFTNFGLTDENVGDLLTIDGAADDDNDGARAIASVTNATTAVTDGAAVNETFGVGVVATLATCLDAELEPYSEYVTLTAAIKALTKEESFAQANALVAQRNLIRADILEAVETDQGGPATIVDTDDEDGW